MKKVPKKKANTIGDKPEDEELDTDHVPVIVEYVGSLEQNEHHQYAIHHLHGGVDRVAN